MYSWVVKCPGDYNPSQVKGFCFLKWLARLARKLTSCHHTLQTDDIGMVKLGHDAGFAQKISPLFLSVADLQSLQGHGDVPLPRQPHTAVTHFPKLSCSTESYTALLLFQTFLTLQDIWFKSHSRVQNSGSLSRDKLMILFH